jgi:hypothetical protein
VVLCPTINEHGGGRGLLVATTDRGREYLYGFVNCVLNTKYDVVIITQ